MKRTFTEAERQQLAPLFRSVLLNMVKIGANVLHLSCRKTPGLEHITLADARAFVNESLSGGKKAGKSLAKRRDALVKGVNSVKDYSKVLIPGHSRPLSKAKAAALLMPMIAGKLRTPQAYEQFFHNIKIYPGLVSWVHQIPEKQKRENRWILDEAYVVNASGGKIAFSSQWNKESFDKLKRMAAEKNINVIYTKPLMKQ
jgi:hypothetical protein